MESRDPVCGMLVDESAGFRKEKDGIVYYFCSQTCYEMFDHEPSAKQPAEV